MTENKTTAVTNPLQSVTAQIAGGKKRPNPGGQEPVAENAAGKLRPGSVSD